MPSKKTTKKQQKKSPQLTYITVSPEVFFGMVLFLGLVVAGLLSGACLRVSQMDITFPEALNRHIVLEHTVRTVVDGYPIELMAPSIAARDQITAAFLVGIAKKESNWGRRVPRDESGADCYNYWGWRGEGSRGIAMGHGCFASPEEAIGIVGGRLDTLIQQYQRDTPAEMIVWKCGTSCAGHSPESVQKWISDVGLYFDKINKLPLRDMGT